MKILHTSDWHLGKRLGDFSRIEEQQAVMQEICDIADREQADAVLVAGDLFDSFNPPTEAVDLFYKTLRKLSKNGSRPVIAIAGNHDSPDRIEAPDPLARACGIIFAGYPHSVVAPFGLDCGLEVIKNCKGFLELKLPGTNVPLRVLMTPYASEFRLKAYFCSENGSDTISSVLQEKWKEQADKFCDDKGVNVLMSHLFMITNGDALPEEPDDEKPIVHVGGAQVVFTESIPSQVQYTALGHLHRMHRAGEQPCPSYYSGSPLSYSFAEASQKKYVLMVEVEPRQQAIVKPVEITAGRPLRRKRANGMDEALQWLHENQDALVELTLVSDIYLTAIDRRKLHAAHKGIVAIVPEITNADNLISTCHKQIDLTKSMEDLFREYFKHEKGQEPDADLINLFTEILAEEEL
jgi:DNA repair protein SbcD/Mre11